MRGVVDRVFAQPATPDEKRNLDRLAHLCRFADVNRTNPTTVTSAMRMGKTGQVISRLIRATIDTDWYDPHRRDTHLNRIFRAVLAHEQEGM